MQFVVLVSLSLFIQICETRLVNLIKALKSGSELGFKSFLENYSQATMNNNKNKEIWIERLQILIL